MTEGPPLPPVDPDLLREAAVLEGQGRFAEACHLRGLGHEVVGRFAEAVAWFDRAIAVRPESPGSLYHKGRILHQVRRYEPALACYERVLALRPDHAATHASRGASLFRLNRFEEALASFERSLALQPGDPEMLTSSAVALHALGRVPEAMARFEAAVAAAPERPETHWYEGMARLSMGDWIAGWRKLEWRWRKEGFAGALHRLPQPLWLGEGDVAGRRLLLHCEQGIGDTLQFVRYAPLVARRGARVLLCVQAALKPLLAGLEGMERVLGRDEPLPAFDLRCPLMSLPHAFGTTEESIPARVPYLTAPPERISRWRQRLGEARAPRIGLVWSGSPDHYNDHHRSVALERLLPLARLPGLEFIGLQRDVRPSDLAALATSGMRQLGDELADFADAAALVSLLDLVVSVDTAAVHLAGAMGRPVWVLLPPRPDWRWLRGRDDSPWYPTARLFRQPLCGGWEEMIGRVRDELLRRAAQPGAFCP